MTLWEFDPHSLSRSNPATDNHAVIIPGQNRALGSRSISPRATGADPTSGKVTVKGDSVVANDGVSDIGLMGWDSTGNMVVKIAPSGYDAATAPDDILVFNSAQDTLKVVDSDVTSILVGASDTSDSVTITHGLGFAPISLVYMTGTNAPAGSQQFPLPGSAAPYYSRTSGFLVFNVYGFQTVTTTTLTITLAMGAASASFAGTWNFKYYLLQETAG